MKPIQITIDVRSWTVSSWSVDEIPVARPNLKAPIVERAASPTFFEGPSANPSVAPKHATHARPRVIKCGEASLL